LICNTLGSLRISNVRAFSIIHTKLQTASHYVKILILLLSEIAAMLETHLNRKPCNKLSYLLRVKPRLSNVKLQFEAYSIQLPTTYIHTYIHMNIHTYVHTYICTYMHTCIHTYIQIVTLFSKTSFCPTTNGWIPVLGTKMCDQMSLWKSSPKCSPIHFWQKILNCYLPTLGKSIPKNCDSCVICDNYPK
jgi:hypothetical protein